MVETEPIVEGTCAYCGESGHVEPNGWCRACCIRVAPSTAMKQLHAMAHLHEAAEAMLDVFRNGYPESERAARVANRLEEALKWSEEVGAGRAV